MVARHHPWTHAPTTPHPLRLLPLLRVSLAAVSGIPRAAVQPRPCGTDTPTRSRRHAATRPKTAPVSRDPDPCPTVAALPLLPAARLHPTPRHQTRRRSSPHIRCVSPICRSLAFAVVEPCPHAAALSRLPQPQQHRALPCLCRAASPTRRRSGQCFQWTVCWWRQKNEDSQNFLSLNSFSSYRMTTPIFAELKKTVWVWIVYQDFQ
ncbi:hypothetical protein U9M48_005525 [Paspalum notatum var. saurae]|uniref:Uncharacterized protein n=1 Tax=Paspalum notatum var. saurae TaxID=547442 RepID=A0AAQ3PR42_PASNO